MGCDSSAPNTVAPEVVGIISRDGFQNFDYIVYVDCTVRNNGADGNITVVAELSNGGFWKKRDEVFISANTERKVTLAFPEATLLDTGLGGYRYNCAGS